MKLATSWFASTAATATSFGIPTATSAPDIPTDDTAVPPPGIGTNDAIVETKMLIESSVQKFTDPPNAAMHASITAAYITALIAFPPSSSSIRRGEQAAAHIVADALLTDGSTRLRTFGTP